MSIKTYSEVIALPNYQERFQYLKLSGVVCHETFGGHRYLNQALYNSLEWRRFRREIIIRDKGCDLADEEYEIHGSILIHHLNPISVDDILRRKHCVFDPENVICTSFPTHNAIHYSNDVPGIREEYEERTENDTCPWR